MKITVRVFTMLVVFAGLALASVSSANANSSSQTAVLGPGPLGLPIPQCGPGIPGCTQNPPPPSRVDGNL